MGGVRQGAVAVTPRRALTGAVLLGAAGAALLLVAAGRTWAVETMVRSAPLPDVRTGLSGAELRPWLPALGWAGLAGAGALLATVRTARRVVGVLLVLVGLLAAVSAATAGAAAPDVTPWWPLWSALGALAVVAGGGWAVRSGHRWPGLSTRFERDRAPAHGPAGRAGPAGVNGAVPATGPAAVAGPASPAELWRALDRGEDPTADPTGH